MQLARRIGRTAMIALTATTTAVVVACTPQAEATESVAAGAPQEITIFAKNYFFVAPDTIEAGLTTFRLKNQGPEHHHVQLVRFTGGKTLDDMFGAMQQNPEAIPPFVVLVGGPNSPEPRGESIGTVNLEPGNYALLCFIPTHEGVPHVAKGMSRALTVVASKREPAHEPIVQSTMVLDDYSFEFSAPLTAGKRTIRVENQASQPHEVFIARLEGDVTPEQAIQVMLSGDPNAPIKAVGGTTFIQPGGSNYITLDLQPGRYALYCFVPDAKDGKPHLMHGMVREITVS